MKKQNKNKTTSTAENNVNATMTPANAPINPPIANPEPTTEPTTETENKRVKIKWTMTNESVMEKLVIDGAETEIENKNVPFSVCTFPTGETVKFNISRIFPDFNKMTETQKFTVNYGIKQFLTDKTAFPKNEKPGVEMLVKIMTERYDDLVNGKTRTNESKTKTAKMDKSKLESITDITQLTAMAEMINMGIVTGYKLTPEQLEILANAENANTNPATTTK